MKVIFQLKVNLKYLFKKIKFLLLKTFFNDSIKENHFELLDKINPVILKNRCKIELIEEKSKLIVRKTFENTIDGKKSFENESKCAELFQKTVWYPKLIKSEELQLEYKFIHNKYRLDHLSKLLSKKEKHVIFERILDIILDLFEANIAHRDIHLKNLFFDGKNLYLIDFETVGFIEMGIDFFDSYDIIGKGLDSPYKTNYMSLMNDSKTSVKSFMGYNNLDFIKETTNKMLKDKLLTSSLSFYSQMKKNSKRHYLIKPQIYSTFDLKHTKINSEFAQRDSKKRICQHQISSKDINNKTVLDLGCHTGSYSFEISKFNPRHVKSLEYDIDKISLANRIKTLNCKTENIIFEQMDFDSDNFLIHFNEVFDVIICLSVIGHLKYPMRFLKKVYEICNEFLLIESNANINQFEMEKMLRNVGFEKVIFLGLSLDEKENSKNNIRPIFKAFK